MSKKFTVWANDVVFGIYDAETEDDARDACAIDAGYTSEDDMVLQLEQPSDLIAELCA